MDDDGEASEGTDSMNAISQDLLLVLMGENAHSGLLVVGEGVEKESVAWLINWLVG